MSQIVPRRRIHTLSFAIVIKDSYSNDRITEGVKILLNKLDYHPVMNSGSYYTFLNLPDGTYTIRVMDESKKYFDEELMIQVPVDNGSDKLRKISLLPRPYYYKFPTGETLLCGTLQQKNESPISDAELRVTLPYRVLLSRTDELGRFVVPFGVLNHKDIVTDNKKDYVKGMHMIGNPRDIDIWMTYPRGFRLT